MTPIDCTKLLRELHALERITAAIAQHGTDGDWRYCVKAMDWEMRGLRYVLSLEPPELVRTCEARLETERRSALVTARSQMQSEEEFPRQDSFSTALPPVPRIH